MNRIEIAPLDFYGLGSLQMRESTSEHAEAERLSWGSVRLDAGNFRSLVFALDARLDSLILEEIMNILASRISTALARLESHPVGISPPRLHTAPSVDAAMRTLTGAHESLLRFEFKSAGRSIPITVYFIPHEVAHV